MQSRDIHELKGSSRNPRQISKDDYEKLKELLDTFGDLSGIVYNVQTEQLVGGHMRTRRFREAGEAAKVVITQRLEQPSKVGTVAYGYVTLGGEFYNYREVDWSPEFEASANIAANRAGGEWDKDLLAEVVHELSELENGDDMLALTGIHDDEINRLLKSVSGEDEPQGSDEEQEHSLDFKLTREQHEIVEEALGHIKASRDIITETTGSRDGTALYYLCRDYLDRLHGMTENDEVAQ